MSSATLEVNFAFADATTKPVSVGTFDVNSDAVTYFKNRLQKFNSTDETTQQKFTNLQTFLKSENGANLTGIKSATITVSQVTRIFDAATYRP